MDAELRKRVERLLREARYSAKRHRDCLLCWPMPDRRRIASAEKRLRAAIKALEEDDEWMGVK